MLIRYGDGLPMNAYPTKKLVRKGPYYCFRHPIYVGFGIFLVGGSMWLGSSSALWMVTPLTILGMIALVLGYELIELKKRFPEYGKPVYFSLPGNENLPASIRQKIVTILIFYSLILCGNLIILYLFGETDYQFQLVDLREPPSSLLCFGLCGFILPVTVLILSVTQSILREWIISSLIAIGLTIYLALLWPGVGAQYFFVDKPGFLVSGLTILKIPLLNAFTLPASLLLLLFGTYSKAFPKLRFLVWIIGTTFAIVFLLLSATPAVNLFITILIFLIPFKSKRIWLFLKNLSERIANSWKEWEIGPVRIINHGIYVGVAAFLGTLIAGFLVGTAYIWGIVVFELVVIVFSALWAQLIEGSEKLKRPFGYYGALVGIIFSSLAVMALEYNVWVIIGVISVMMPWAQGIGRLRCLVNGCCHGSETHNHDVGIKYFHPRSRVCGISNLKGKSLHPTPLYAIIWLFFVGFVLLALWYRGVSSVFLFGMYLILAGIGRFVEEAYRGEVQTPVLYGLRLYQWMAILSVIIGMVFTTIRVTDVVVQVSHGPSVYIAAIIMGLFTFFAMGVDFPKSNRRFSRLV